MRRHIEFIATCGFVLTVSVICTSLLLAVEPKGNAVKDNAEKDAVAKKLVDEALYSEIYGDAKNRDRLLDAAARQNPEFAPAMWHRGFVKVNDTWVKASDLIEQTIEAPLFRRYQELAEKQPDTVEGHLEIADWCHKYRLYDRERAHLEAVLRSDPDHLQARQRLGHVRVNGGWMTEQQIKGELDRVEQDRRNLSKWERKLNKIGEKLFDTDPLIRNAAEVELTSIKESSAILPLEWILSSRDQRISKLVVETIAKMPEQEAATSLARHAVFSPWPAVRELAAVKLRDYDRMMFVPTMLSSMETPIANMRWAVPGADGRLCYRHALFVETQDNTQLAVRDTEYRRVALPGGIRDESLARAINDLNRNMAQTDMAVAMRNLQTEQLNERISQALSVATSTQMVNNPRAWWQWWNDENEIFVGSKPQLVDQQTRSVEIVDISRPLIALSRSGSGSQAPRFTGDCLIAGTKILTDSGLKEVQKIRTGDLVLSKNETTGELAFKPVIQTTIRPSSGLISVEVGNGEKIRCSGGHPFWVSGQGWTKARDLEPGMSLHTSEGFVSIKSVASDVKEQTYNLVVADFHTYFVGTNAILSHDNTLREAITTSVPGLAE